MDLVLPPPPTLSPPPAERALPLDALAVVLRLRRSPLPPRWSAPAFVRSVDLVRTHLAPIRGRGALAQSFSREAFHGMSAPGLPDLDESPVRVAYAIRWLELGDGVARPAWRAWLDAPADDPLVAPIPA
jgi:hypothetical protein